MKDYDLSVVDLESGQVKTLLKDINKPSTQSLENSKPVRIFYNPHNPGKHSLILKCNATKASEAKIFFIDVDKKTFDTTKKQAALSNAVFIGKQKIAILNNGNVEVSDTETMLSLGSIADIDKVDDIFPGAVGKFIYRKGNTAYYYDTVSKKTVDEISEFNLKSLKSVHWNKDFRFAMLVCKKDMYLMSKAFKTAGEFEDHPRLLDQGEHLHLQHLQSLQVCVAKRRQRHPQVGERHPLSSWPRRKRFVFFRHRQRSPQVHCREGRVPLQTGLVPERHQCSEAVCQDCQEERGQRNGGLPPQEKLSCRRVEHDQRQQVQVPAGAQVWQSPVGLRFRSGTQESRELRKTG
jgi:hypothetical protein